MILRFLTVLIGIGFVLTGFGQNSNENDTDFWDKVYFGGNVQLQFGTISVVNLSPVMGYRITKTSSVGLGPVYERYSNNGFVTSVYGGRLIGKQLITKQFLAQAEFEDLVIKTTTTKRKLQRALIGGGYREHLGGNIYAQLIFLWDVTHNSNSYSRDPFVWRGGITVGL